MVITNSHHVEDVFSKNIKIPDGNRSKEKDMVKRKFRVVSLRYPSDIKHPSIQRIMEESQSFHMWFEREQDKYSAEKMGGLSLVFDSAKRAHEMYSSVRRLRLGGSLIKLQASKSLTRQDSEEGDDDNDPTDEDFLLEDPNVFKKILVSNLLPSTDRDIVAAIFATKGVTDIHLAEDGTKKDGGKMAIVTLRTEDAANDAVQFDGFSIDDEEVSRPMKILKYTEHLKQLFRKQKQAGTLDQLLNEEDIVNGSPLIGDPDDQSTSIKNQDSNKKVEDGEISDDEKAGTSNTVIVGPARVEQEIGRMMRISRVKWTDMCTAEDLWMLLQQVITECGDVENEVLVEGMTLCLRNARTEASAEWQRQHIDELIGEWKKCGLDGPKEDAEVSNTAKPAVSSEAAAYIPMGSGKKRPPSSHDSKELVGLMGVGALLSDLKGVQPEAKIGKFPIKSKSSHSTRKSVSGGSTLRKRGRSRSRGSSSGRSSSRGSNSSSDSRSSGEQRALKKLKNLKSESSILNKRPRGTRRDYQHFDNEPLLTSDALLEGGSGRSRGSRLDRAGKPILPTPVKATVPKPAAAPQAQPVVAGAGALAVPSVAPALPQNPQQMMMSMMANMMNPAMMMNMMAPNMMTTMQRMMSMMQPGQQAGASLNLAQIGGALPAAIRPAAGLMGNASAAAPVASTATAAPNPMALMQQMMQQQQRRMAQSAANAGSGQQGNQSTAAAGGGGFTSTAGQTPRPYPGQQQPYPGPVSNPGNAGGKTRVFAPAASGPYALPINSMPK